VDYVLALKDITQSYMKPLLFGWITRSALRGAGRLLPAWENEIGRIERKRYWLSDGIDWLENRGDWTQLNSVHRVESGAMKSTAKSVLSVTRSSIHLPIWKKIIPCGARTLGHRNVACNY